MTQQKFFLSIIEKYVRSNLYLFIFFRYITSKFFTKYIFESDFKILKILKQKKYFAAMNNPIIDIGANDGISYKTIRNFLKKTKIISFEPQKKKFFQLKNLKKKDINYKIFSYGLSTKKGSMKLYVPFFKNIALSPFAGLNKKEVISRLNQSIFVKNLLNKIKFKSFNIQLKKLDDFKFKPSFIKIDIEGHEYECIQGSIKTIKKNKPILLVEYNYLSNKKILKLLKQFDYNSYYFNSKNNKIIKHKKEKIFNIFYIDKKKAKIIQNKNDFN